MGKMTSDEPNKQPKEMKSFKSGAIRENKDGKGRHDLLPFCALNRLAKHFQRSLREHPERNWEKGIPMSSFLDSAIRHLFNYMDGQADEDHLCSAAWNILCAMWTEEKLPQMQNIPSRLIANKSIPIYVNYKGIVQNESSDQVCVCHCAGCTLFGKGFTQECSRCEELIINRD